jgi:hypothetical protein
MLFLNCSPSCFLYGSQSPAYRLAVSLGIFLRPPSIAFSLCRPHCRPLALSQSRSRPRLLSCHFSLACSHGLEPPLHSLTSLIALALAVFITVSLIMYNILAAADIAPAGEIHIG